MFVNDSIVSIVKLLNFILAIVIILKVLMLHGYHYFSRFFDKDEDCLNPSQKIGYYRASLPPLS